MATHIVHIYRARHLSFMRLYIFKSLGYTEIISHAVLKFFSIDQQPKGMMQ